MCPLVSYCALVYSCVLVCTRVYSCVLLCFSWCFVQMQVEMFGLMHDNSMTYMRPSSKCVLRHTYFYTNELVHGVSQCMMCADVCHCVLIDVCHCVLILWYTHVYCMVPGNPIHFNAMTVIQQPTPLLTAMMQHRREQWDRGQASFETLFERPDGQVHCCDCVLVYYLYYVYYVFCVLLCSLVY